MEQTSVESEVEQILRQAAEGDAQAWRSLVERYSPRVFGLIVRQCGDRDLAEEITQGTFVKLVTHLPRYREFGRFEPWLFRIAMNRLRDEMRRRKRQATPMDTAEGGDEPGGWAAAQEQSLRHTADPTDSPLERMTRAEQVDRVREAVSRLGESDREILHLRHTADLTFAQIAEMLEQPLGTVLARGHRAVAKLRKLLQMQDEE